MATAQEIGARLQAMGPEIVRAANEPKGALAGALADAVNYLAQIMSAVNDPVNEVATMLGETHPGATAIIGVTAAVSDKAEPMQELLQKLINEVEALGTAIDNVGWTYNNVGGDIAAAGGGV